MKRAPRLRIQHLVRLGNSRSTNLQPTHPTRVLRCEPLERRQLLAADVLGGGTSPLGFAEGESQQISWSIVPDNTPIASIEGTTGGSSNLVAKLNQVFGSPENWEHIFENALAAWDEISSVHFVREANDDGAVFPTSEGATGLRGDVRFAGYFVDGELNTLALATSTQDIILDTAFGNAESFLPQLTYILTHEVGHILGLQHVYPRNNSKMMETEIPEKLFSGPQFDDVLQVQALHGDDYEPNDSRESSNDLGTLPIGMTSIEKASLQNALDQDYYRFTVRANQLATFRLIPTGLPYPRSETPVSVAQAPVFDPRLASDLQLELRDGEGNLIRVASGNAIGLTETIERVLLEEPGEYLIRVSGTGNQTQAYQLSIELLPPGENSPSNQLGDALWLRDQIDSANQSGLETVINIPAGVYKLDQELLISGNVILVGSNSSEVILDGQNKTRILYASEGSNLGIRNLSLVRGKADSGGAIRGYRADIDIQSSVIVDNNAINGGGGINATEGSIKIDATTIAFNSTEHSGGGIYLWSMEARITNSLISENSAANGAGISAGGNLSIETSRLLSNRATGGSGALGFESDGGLLRMTNCWVIGNTAPYAGGLGLGRGQHILTRVQIEGNQSTFSGGGLRLADLGTLILNQSLVSNNQAYAGAGMSISPNTQATVSKTWVRGNQAISTGGGIATQGRVQIEASTVSENSARDWFGGGLSISDTGELLMLNSTVTQNRAQNAGAGVVSFAGGAMELVNSTITDNYLESTAAAQGAGVHIHPAGSALLTNTIVANNSNGGVTDIFGEFFATHSLLGAIDEQSALMHLSNGNLIGTPESPLDPMLGPLADNGGDTPTQRPLNGSPALDAGIKVKLIGDLDQRGVARNQRPDLGSMEASNTTEFTNQPPTLFPVPEPAPLPLGTLAHSIVLSGITDGNNDLQSVQVKATTDNPSLVSQINIGSIADQTAELQYIFRAGVSGLATVTVTVRDPGNDAWFGTSDDGITSQSFRVAVVDAFHAEAELSGQTTVARNDASAGFVVPMIPSQPLTIPLSIESETTLANLLIRHNNSTSGASLEVYIDTEPIATVDLSATNAQSLVSDIASLAYTLTQGSHQLELVLRSSQAIDLDVVAGLSDGPPTLHIDDGVILEPADSTQPVQLLVSLSKPASEPISFRVSTMAGTATNHTGTTATDGGSNHDFEPIDQVLTIPAGETSLSISIPIYADQFQEPTETFTVQLSEITNAIAVRSTAIAEIIDAPIVFGSPILPTIRQNPMVLPTIYVNVHSTGPTAYPPTTPPVVRPPLVVGRLLATAYGFSDVNRDGRTTALDALQIINRINSGIATTAPLDVNLDGITSALDVLLVVNEINRLSDGQGEGEAFLAIADWMDWTEDLLLKKRETAGSNAGTADQVQNV